MFHLNPRFRAKHPATLVFKVLFRTSLAKSESAEKMADSNSTPGIRRGRSRSASPARDRDRQSYRIRSPIASQRTLQRMGPFHSSLAGLLERRNRRLPALYSSQAGTASPLTFGVELGMFKFSRCSSFDCIGWLTWTELCFKIHRKTFYDYLGGERFGGPDNSTTRSYDE